MKNRLEIGDVNAKESVMEEEAETTNEPEQNGGEGPEVLEDTTLTIAERIESRIQDRRLKEWLAHCDPELALLCILMARRLLGEPDSADPDEAEEVYAGDGLANYYAGNPHRLLRKAGVPKKWWDIWTAGDWAAFEDYLFRPNETGLPASRVFP